MGIICFFCGCIGHQENSCPIVAFESSRANIVGVDDSPGEACKEDKVEQSSRYEKFSPWMVVQRRNSFSKKRVVGKAPTDGVNLAKSLGSNSKCLVIFLRKGCRIFWVLRLLKVNKLVLLVLALITLLRLPRLLIVWRVLNFNRSLP